MPTINEVIKYVIVLLITLVILVGLSAIYIHRTSENKAIRRRRVQKAMNVLALLILVGAFIVATMKAFIGGQPFFMVSATILFVALCLLAFIMIKGAKE